MFHFSYSRETILYYNIINNDSLEILILFCICITRYFSCLSNFHQFEIKITPVAIFNIIFILIIEYSLVKIKIKFSTIFLCVTKTFIKYFPIIIFVILIITKHLSSLYEVYETLPKDTL